MYEIVALVMLHFMHNLLLFFNVLMFSAISGFCYPIAYCEKQSKKLKRHDKLTYKPIN